MRQEVARRVHDVNLPLAIRHPDVNVHAKDEQRAGHGLQFLHQQLVPIVIEDF
jgi:hypothetical protein